MRKSLALLAVAHEDGAGKPVEGELCISSTPGFASMWLCNHIASFHEQYPGLALQIVTGGELDAASDRDADLFIVFGDGNWPRHTVQHLYDVAVFAIVQSRAAKLVRAGSTVPPTCCVIPCSICGKSMNGANGWRQGTSICFGRDRA